MLYKKIVLKISGSCQENANSPPQWNSPWRVEGSYLSKIEVRQVRQQEEVVEGTLLQAEQTDLLYANANDLI